MTSGAEPMQDKGEIPAEGVEQVTPEVVQVIPKNGADSPPLPASSNGVNETEKHGVPELVGQTVVDDTAPQPVAGENEKRSFLDHLRVKRRGIGQYIKTKEFWMVLVLGQVLSICLTSTNVFSALLSMDGVSIPAFQNLFNYCLLNLVYTSFTLYKYGFKKWWKLLLKDGWRYFLLAFVDVEGNYFFVLAYRYTTILSCTLIDFWAIVVVMLISFFVLKVRYHVTQYVGIFFCVGGLGILLGSDHLTGYNQFPASDALKGDLFCLLGATFYGISNVLEEFLVSKRPMYEVIGQLGFWGMFINGVQAAIFDRASFRNAVWKPVDGGYLTGYTLILSLFYTLAPLLFRMASAAFFNISLLTSDFWSVIIGLQRFHYHVHWMYPIAFVLILIGLLVYFLTESILGDSHKPWLGENQELGVRGIGTARRRLERHGNVTEGTPGPGVV